MKRTFLSLLIILVYSFANCQSHLPTLVSFSLSPETVANKESIEITVNAYDSIYGIGAIGVTITDPTDFLIDQVIMSQEQYVGNNTYKAKYKISEWAVSGTYKAGDLVVFNHNDNMLYDAQRIPFEVVSFSPDTIPPTIVSVNFNKDTFNIGDILEIRFETYDEVSGLNFAKFCMADRLNNYTTEVRYFNGSDIQSLGNNNYLIERTIFEETLKDNYQFYMEIFDKADNSSDYRAPNPIYINGIEPATDIYPPIISAVMVYPDTINLLDSLYVILDAKDYETGLKFGNLILNTEGGRTDYHHFDFGYSTALPIAKDQYLISMEIPLWYAKGNRDLKIRIYDQKNNVGKYNHSSNIYITDVIDSTKLGVDQLENENRINVFPNPFQSVVNITVKDNSFDEGKLKIYTIEGKLIKEIIISKNTSIDLGYLNKGVYNFVITVDKFQLSQMMIK